MLPTVLTINGEMKKFEVCPREQFMDPLPPPPINFVHDHLFSAKLLLFFFIILGLGKVKTISGPSAAARTG